MDYMDYQSDQDQNEPQGIRALLKNTRFVGLSMFLIGVLFGWLAIGWGVWPLEWTDASASDLRADLQEDYLRMAVDSFAVNGNITKALDRMEALGEDLQPIFATVEANPGNKGSRAAIQTLQPQIAQGGGIAATTPQPLAPQQIPPDDNTGSLLLVACGITSLLAIILVVVYFFKNRTRRPGKTTVAMRAQEMSRAAQQQRSDNVYADDDPPIAQWITTYLIGDDLFDDSFSIDSGAGEFMGECGVGIADLIGVGDPKRVSAFEVWLFDKNDIQTITKVIMSDHLYQDHNARGRLAAKGEPIQAVTGYEIVLETATLQMVVRIVDMAYGDGAMPERSFFERVTLELAVWSK